MIFYIVRRVLYSIPIALSVGLVCFLLVYISPGDPISAIAPPDAPAEMITQLRRDYGLDKPLPEQFLIWLGRVVQGDLGHSLATGRSVWSEVSVALQNTVSLAVAACTLAFAVGMLLGGLAAAFRDTWIDRIAMTFAVAGVSVPHYWLGMLLVAVFAVTYPLAPSMGAGPGGTFVWDWAHLPFLILPMVTLSAIPLGLVARTVRGTVIEILHQEFITTLRGKGLRSGGILLHVAKNAAPSVLAVMGLQLGYLMGGSILVETVFSWPGTGFLLNSAIFQRDIPLLQGTILVLALLFVALNLVVDLGQALLDPRIKR
ncbi:MAG TPA: ABC transporter permease [Xanthobacteraceae bacterium]|jgi:peptide/nickel transport system permease protein|uniref:ABC transporter permease n=1 Tax=Roseixanthobacter finlandensis TaxID=3119922 RepID=UPI000BC8FB6E|nr:MAG: ABC transporter permease [Rhizobiales bacterium 35-66-30]OZB00449.1 MAG: ABC transporter permease [Rhizobiales bacterium 39-66-18]HQS08417.1 ABC transporter permease [Xanthobacteraceae bacterium]HQS46228.1 ABC transporter permease [Xanthobacteraceae bacterium]